MEELESSICPDSMHSPLVRQVMEQVSAEFEPQTWTAFCKTTLDGLPAASVAEELGISVDSVYQAKSRVLRKLRKYLAELPS